MGQEKTDVGALMSELHEFTWKSKDDGDCGSHGCTGHTTWTVKCTCGWKQVFPGQYFGRPDEDALMLEHRLDYLEAQLRKKK